MNLQRMIWIAALVLLAAGCSEGGEEVASDGEFDNALTNGKADSALSECQLDAMLLLVNDPSESVQSLRDAGVHGRAATNIIASRAGIDALADTDDDVRFDSIEALDAVSWVGPRAFEQLGNAVADMCHGVTTEAEVIMSPLPIDVSHVARAEALIEKAQRSIDVAMYSFRLSSLREALGRAVARGVEVRVMFESANRDRKQADGTMSHKLEELGIDVRYVNKIMHHKFMLVDGPQNHLTEAIGATLFSGSGNWSSSAATRYDENTVVVTGSAELALRFQAEFNLLWDNSRDFAFNPALAERVDTMRISDDMIVDDPFVDAAFTSANFDTKFSNTYGWTFTSVRGRNTIADRIVQLVGSAEDSIIVASGHLRSRPISEAIMARMIEKPDLEVLIYLDGQEYISRGSQERQDIKLAECLDEAGSDEGDRADCFDTGFYFSLAMHDAGAEVRFKHYAYRWHYSYAPQMHHKYLIVDRRHVVSGSYNLSDNAEHNTMENVIVFDGLSFPGVLDAFMTNFETIWETGVDDRLYEQLLYEIEHGTGDIPLIYDAMALTWPQVTELKALIRAVCPAINTEEFRRHPESHHICPRI